MKKKLIIVSASVLVLALIVGMGFYAQSRTEGSKNIATEQTDENVPENCKKCPELSKCIGEKGEVTEAACASKCEKKDCEKCDKKATCDKAKCGDAKTCDKAATCDKAKACDKAAKCGEVKSTTTPCSTAATCQKECEKKKN
ncbi:MAG: hypothetical protein AB9846_12975 [Tenuifilaceae bacterium]